MSHVILVNDNDEIIGTADKLKAHQEGLLHRAFSVFIYRNTLDTIEILLQQRHPQKYHSGDLWTNTCCSHPLPFEETKAAAHRRLEEEMGLKINLTETGVFHYCKTVNNHLIENEIDHIFIGHFTDDLKIAINTEEVKAYQWITLTDLKADIQKYPERYTVWLLEALKFTGF